MKNLCFLTFCLSFCVFPVLAQEPNSSCVVNPLAQEYDSDTSDDYYEDNVMQKYGSEQSPAFLNRENMNPNEDSYGYGTSDGVNSDSYDDSPYEYEP